MFKRYQKPQPHETSITGSWVHENGAVKADDVCERIEYLKSSYLRRVGVSKEFGDWMVLYQDPEDMRYWALTYPQSEMHGGGPPALMNISKEEANSKYQITGEASSPW